MSALASLLFYLLPLCGFILLLLGLAKNHTNSLLSALWISLIALVLHYQMSGGEILGSYFGYKNATIYSFNLLVLIITLVTLCFKIPLLQTRILRYGMGFICGFLIISASLLTTNLWINANFIENRRPGSPILQVATFKKVNYCSYRYVFYKINNEGKISYMCPNYYGVIPSIGQLDMLPNVVLNHLATPVKKED